jgi:uncharacterized protein YndB with AHSA1/START domain
MTVANVHKDPENLTMTITVDLVASVERSWQLWADPRQLERWWGPPTYPATVIDHDLAPGGRITYFMTGPMGDKSNGWLEVVAAEPPRRLELKDGFANDDFEPNDTMPVSTMTITLEPHGDAGDRTRMTIATRYASAEAMDQMLAMGMEEGMSLAVGQMDAILGTAAG